MKKVLNCNSKAGSKKSNKPRQRNHNTDLCVDLKTILRFDHLAVIGRSYLGVLTHDKVDHYTFTETSNAGKRNPHVFVGKFITITCRDDGAFRLNFRPISMGPDFNPANYATGVANELLWALTSLLEK
jgi:hypothetical protein